MASRMRMVPLCLVVMSLGALAQVQILGGIQKELHDPNMSEACSEALNTVMDCPEAVRYLGYPVLTVDWDAATLGSLCARPCQRSFGTLITNVAQACTEDIIEVTDFQQSYVDLVEAWTDKQQRLCSIEDATGDFCHIVEKGWNIGALVASSQATWPTHTNKCYGFEDEIVHPNGTCEIVRKAFEPKTAAEFQLGRNKAAEDYFDLPDPNPLEELSHGWNEPLEWDEYPLETQCSDCFLQMMRERHASRWREVWTSIDEQVWDNVVLNCGLTGDDTIVEKFTDTTGMTPEEFPEPGLNWDACPQTIALPEETEITCDTLAVTYSIPSAGIRRLNSLWCGGPLHGITVCAPLSCPYHIATGTDFVENYVRDSLSGITLAQFLQWNVFVNPVAMVYEDDLLCVGPPQGEYQPAVVPIESSTTCSTTSTPTSPLPSPTVVVENCCMYHSAEGGDSCASISIQYKLPFEDFLALNPMIDSTCSNFEISYDYCVDSVGDPTTTTPTPTPTTTTYPGIAYMGCYADWEEGWPILEQGWWWDDSMSIDTCKAFCDGGGWPFFGVEQGRECYCSDTLHSSALEAPLADCTWACLGDPSQQCGGDYRMDLYGPEAWDSGFNYVGCFTDGTSTPALSETWWQDNAISTWECSGFCTSWGGMSMLGVEDSDVCYCGNEIADGAVPVPEGDCMTPCPGDSAQLCGGPNRMRVYRYS